MTVIVDRGGSGMDPTGNLPCGDGADSTFFGKPVFVDNGCC